MAELYNYKSDFEPIMLPGETAQIITSTDKFNVQCMVVGALPEYKKNFGALTAATWDTDQEDENLEMTPNTLAQYRMRIVDPDVKLRFNNLSPTRQWRTSKTDFFLTNHDLDLEERRRFFWLASEFFVWGDNTPRFDFYSTLATLKCEVEFSGFRFACKKVNLASHPAKTIWVSGWPGSGGE